MPAMIDPLAIDLLDRLESKQELIHALRFNITAEFEAIQLYMQLAQSASDRNVRTVLVEVANEERERAAEFLSLLQALAPGEEKYYQEGEQRVAALFQKMERA